MTNQSTLRARFSTGKVSVIRRWPLCSAVNAIDASALESLEAINHRLADSGVSLHLSEVKGPVTDALARSHFLEQLTGKVFLSQDDAF